MAADRITAVRDAAFRRPEGGRAGPPPAAQGRALVPVPPPVPHAGGSALGRGGFAPFLVHLLAVREHVAHLRRRRRTTPAVAAARYATAAQGEPAPSRKRFDRFV